MRRHTCKNEVIIEQYCFYISGKAGVPITNAYICILYNIIIPKPDFHCLATCFIWQRIVIFVVEHYWTLLSMVVVLIMGLVCMSFLRNLQINVDKLVKKVPINVLLHTWVSSLCNQHNCHYPLLPLCVVVQCCINCLWQSKRALKLYHK